ncbi:TPA: phage tail protein [Yersinia enterocolitica]|uniref:phage tail-collar fiber domain-containing protein n=1 Tax=Yersinia enterocolitica TaxID=630 RepID=UPI00067BEF6D|nr:phage tail protein [Yersinia enterocolitica]HDL8132545.1 phage tail protein [Yersinia enterocolitica]
MSQSIITTAFEQWKAQEAAGGNTVVVDEFVLALVPGLDPNAPIDRSEGLPPAGQIVHRQAVNKTGVVNQNAVVYSITLGTEIGDFDFNWIGLVNKASSTVAMIVHAPTQRKIANANGQQGNALTRSFLMEYDGAASETGITVPAETWQIDFTARLTGIDEMQRLINLDHYGPGAFFADGFLVAKTGQQYYVTAGSAYVGGLRAVLAANKNITVSAKPVKVWADVSLQGNVVSQWESVVTVTVAATLADYQDNAGFMHRVFAVASIDAAGNITDLRPQGSLTEQETSDALAQHEKSRNHPDGTLLYKGFVQLDSATDSSSETLAATPKAVKIAMDNANARLAKERNGADIPNVPLFRQNLGIKGAASLEVGTTAGTVAAGNDIRIVNAVQSTNTAISLPGSLTTAGTVTGGGISSIGAVYAGNTAAWLAADGNVYGSVWGGYLSTYIGNMRNTALKDWNGWFRDASTGLITQWCTGGGVTHETQNIITYFPMAFPNACLMAHVSTKSPDQNFDNDVFYQTASWNNTYVVTMLQRPAGARAGTNVYPLFIAIGY